MTTMRDKTQIYAAIAAGERTPGILRRSAFRESEDVLLRKMEAEGLLASTELFWCLPERREAAISVESRQPSGLAIARKGTAG